MTSDVPGTGPSAADRHDRHDRLWELAAHLRSLVDLSGVRPLTVVVELGAEGSAVSPLPKVARRDAARSDFV